MKPYDPSKRYFGPQDHWLCDFIPEFPPNMPVLRLKFNKPAYNHDAGYEGEKRSGFMGRIKDAWERWAIDKRFLFELNTGIEEAFNDHQITCKQMQEATAYAKAAYLAVRAVGWSFFRRGN